MEGLFIKPGIYADRVQRMQALLIQHGLDAVIIASDEAEPANVRYFSGYAPVFETAAVLIPQDGDAILMTGPESEALVDVHSVLPKARKLLELRESSDPEYPDIVHSTFRDLFDEASNGKSMKRIGLIGTNVMTVQMYEGIQSGAKNASLIKCDDLLRGMRMIKSSEELALLRKAADAAQNGFAYAIERIRPGMTEFEAAAEATYGIAQAGAESTGFIIWCVSGPNTNQAIGRSTYRKIQKNELVQLTIGANVGGYVSSFGRPFSFGPLPKEQQDVLDMGLEANKLTHSMMKAGVLASEVAKIVHGLVRQKGFGDFIVYGPAHGIGMMECEYPFVEVTSDYAMQANMTYAVDTFLGNRQFGMRFEDTIAITEDGEEQFAPKFRHQIIL